MLSVPPPTRIPLGTIQVGGKTVEMFLSPEWARYFQSLNAQVVGSGAGAALGNALAMLLGDAPEAPDAFPGPAGPRGSQGDPGLALFMLQDQASDEPMLVSPSAMGAFTTVTATAGFGCNGKAAQPAAASGGTLAGVIAALIANGILSS